MRRLNPNLKRRLLWIGILGLSWGICAWGLTLFKLGDPENEYRRILEDLKWIFAMVSIFAPFVIVVGLLGFVVWFARSVDSYGLSSTIFFRPALAKNTQKKAQEMPSWLAFFMRAAIFLGASIVIFLLRNLPCCGDRHSSLHSFCALTLVPLLFSLFFVSGSASRYYSRRRRYIFCLESPTFIPYDPAILLTIKAPRLHIGRERSTQAWWNLSVLAHSRYEAEGKFPDGTAFSIKLDHRMPWFRSSRLAAVLRVYGEKSRAAAIVSAKNATIFPTEAAVNLGPILSQAQAFLLRHDSSFLTVTTHYIQATFLQVWSVDQAFEAVELARQIQVNLQLSRDGAYRGDSPLSATPAEIAQIEAIAEAAWTSFPSKPRGSQQ